MPDKRPYERRCGTCVWHHDLLGTNESGGVRNCLARDWPEVEAILTTESAVCDLPEKYLRKEEKMNLTRTGPNR